MSEEIEVACLLCLSDDKLPAETFWAVCQMTNCPQRRFEPFVRWQIVPRDVLSHLSDDKSSPETFWAVCQMTNCPQRRFEPFVRWQIVPRGVFGTSGPFHFKKNDDLRASPFWSFCLKGYFYGLPRWRSQWRVWGHWIATLRSQWRVWGHWIAMLRSQWRVWGHWIATLTLAMMGLVHEFTKVFSPARG